MKTMNKDVLSEEELDKLKKHQEEYNVQYHKAANEQLEEWIKGNSIHNKFDRIMAVVNDDGDIVSFYKLEGGECCPDFSCCQKDGWPIEKRKKFYELYKNGNVAACEAMLMIVAVKYYPNNK